MAFHRHSGAKAGGCFLEARFEYLFVCVIRLRALKASRLELPGLVLYSVGDVVGLGGESGFDGFA